MSPTGPPEREVRLVVDAGSSGRRLDAWLAGQFDEYSRTRLQTWIREGRVLLDGIVVRVGTPLAAGSIVIVRIPEPAPAALEPEPIPLNILHEDEHVLVLLKPAGLQVHPGAGAPRPTLVHALLHHYPGVAFPGPPERPGIIHRLDRDTSGLMLVARTPLAYRRLGRQIMERTVTRRYIALVWGDLDRDAGLIEHPIARDPRDRRRMAVVPGGRAASTRWRVLLRFDSLSLLDIGLGTGRTHQIRVHLSHEGHPVFADAAYGGGRVRLERVQADRRAFHAELLRRLNRQALHAYHLAFRHPVGGGWMRFEAPVPADLDEILTRLAGQGGAA